MNVLTTISTISTISPIPLNLENLPEHLLTRILEKFQTRIKVHDRNVLTNFDFRNLVKSRRKYIDIETDVKTLINVAETCPKLYNFIMKSTTGLLIWEIYYNSLMMTKINKQLDHIKLCDNNERCPEVTHYINKNIRHSDIHKTIAKYHYTRQSRCKKTNAMIKNEQKSETEFSESWEFYSVSSDLSYDS